MRSKFIVHLRRQWMGAPALAILAAVLGIAALAPTAPAQEQPQEEEIGLLFAQTANRGTMKPIKGPTPRFNLRLYGVNPQVVWFSDRPERQSGQLAVPDFTRTWAGYGFVEDPPNAALTLLDAGGGHDTVVMELGQPDFKMKKNRIRYTAQLLDAATGNLSYLNSDLDPRVNRRFHTPSLFIDDASATVVNGCPIQPHASCGGKTLNQAALHGANLSGANLRAALLSGADLSEANLSGTNLNYANLSGANLTAANLSGADLDRALLPGANLQRADLIRADLRLANLEGADLTGANLTAAQLGSARLIRANLSGANLSRAELRLANLEGADLTGADLKEARFCQTKMPDGSTNNRDCR